MPQMPIVDVTSAATTENLHRSTAGDHRAADRSVRVSPLPKEVTVCGWFAALGPVVLAPQLATEISVD